MLLHMHFECLIRFTQFLVWLQPYTGEPITKRCLPHRVMEMISVVPCRAFTVHHIPTDTEWILKRVTDYDHTTSRSAKSDQAIQLVPGGWGKVCQHCQQVIFFDGCPSFLHILANHCIKVQYDHWSREERAPFSGCLTMRTSLIIVTSISLNSIL